MEAQMKNHIKNWKLLLGVVFVLLTGQNGYGMCNFFFLARLKSLWRRETRRFFSANLPNVSEQYRKKHSGSPFLKKQLENTKIKNEINNILEQEKKSQQNGNYTMYHGRAKEWALLTDIRTEIEKLQTNESDDMKFILSFENKPFLLFKEKAKHKKAIKNIDGYYYFKKKKKNQARRLFLSPGLFSGIGSHYDSALHFWIENRSVRRNIVMEDIFEKAGLKKHFKKHKRSLEGLADQHWQAFKTGELLQIEFTPQQLKDYTVPAFARGGKNSEASITDGETIIKTFNSKVILDAIRSKGLDSVDIRPKCCHQFVMPITHAYTLHPKKGPKIHRYAIRDAKEYQKYLEMRKNIFEKIKQDIEKEETLWSFPKELEYCCDI